MCHYWIVYSLGPTSLPSSAFFHFYPFQQNSQDFPSVSVSSCFPPAAILSEARSSSTHTIPQTLNLEIQNDLHIWNPQVDLTLFLGRSEVLGITVYSAALSWLPERFLNVSSFWRHIPAFVLGLLFLFVSWLFISHLFKYWNVIKLAFESPVFFSICIPWNNSMLSQVVPFPALWPSLNQLTRFFFLWFMDPIRPYQCYKTPFTDPCGSRVV